MESQLFFLQLQPDSSNVLTRVFSKSTHSLKLSKSGPRLQRPWSKRISFTLPIVAMQIFAEFLSLREFEASRNKALSWNSSRSIEPLIAMHLVYSRVTPW